VLVDVASEPLRDAQPDVVGRQRERPMAHVRGVQGHRKAVERQRLDERRSVTIAGERPPNTPRLERRRKVDVDERLAVTVDGRHVEGRRHATMLSSARAALKTRGR
jgi:hypothetical protein